MIAIIDYGVGNLYSISHSLSYLGMENTVTRDEDTILNADKLVLTKAAKECVEEVYA